MEKGQVNTAAMWVVVTLLTGSGTVLYPQLASVEDLHKSETRLNLKIDAFSGGIYELFLDNVDEKMIELESIPMSVRSNEQNQTLIRLRIRKEKLLRILNQEAAKK